MEHKLTSYLLAVFAIFSYAKILHSLEAAENEWKQGTESFHRLYNDTKTGEEHCTIFMYLYLCKGDLHKKLMDAVPVMDHMIYKDCENVTSSKDILEMINAILDQMSEFSNYEQVVSYNIEVLLDLDTAAIADVANYSSMEGRTHPRVLLPSLRKEERKHVCHKFPKMKELLDLLNAHMPQLNYIFAFLGECVKTHFDELELARTFLRREEEKEYDYTLEENLKQAIVSRMLHMEAFWNLHRSHMDVCKKVQDISREVANELKGALNLKGSP